MPFRRTPISDSVEDLTKDGTTFVIGSESVPIGAYTRETLAKLPPDQEKAILANVRSNEPDVKGIVGKLTQGAADAGFVYVTDVNATGGDLKAIKLADGPRAEGDLRRRGRQTGRSSPSWRRSSSTASPRATAPSALADAGFGPAP